MLLASCLAILVPISLSFWLVSLIGASPHSGNKPFIFWLIDTRLLSQWLLQKWLNWLHPCGGWFLYRCLFLWSFGAKGRRASIGVEPLVVNVFEAINSLDDSVFEAIISLDDSDFETIYDYETRVSYRAIFESIVFCNESAHTFFQFHWENGPTDKMNR